MTKLKKREPVYYVMDIKDIEHTVTVEYDAVVESEDEGHAEINLIWSVSEDRELFEADLHPASFERLQETLDQEVAEIAHDLYYERQMSRAYDRAKDRMKYGDD